MRLRVPIRSEHDLASFAEWGIDLDPLPGRSEIQLPDFSNSLTRMVYAGIAHSFLPPPSRVRRILCEIEFAQEEIGGRPFRQIYETMIYQWLRDYCEFDCRASRSAHDGVVMISIDRLVVYVEPEEIDTLDRQQISTMISEVREAKWSDPYPPFGAIADAIAGPFCYHFAMLDGKPVFLGVAPKYDRERE